MAPDGVFKVLDISGPENIGIYALINTLREMLEDHTALVVECFAKLTDSVIKNRSNLYIQPDKAKPILRAGLNSEDNAVREKPNGLARTCLDADALIF